MNPRMSITHIFCTVLAQVVRGFGGLRKSGIFLRKNARTATAPFYMAVTGIDLKEGFPTNETCWRADQRDYDGMDYWFGTLIGQFLQLPDPSISSYKKYLIPFLEGCPDEQLRPYQEGIIQAINKWLNPDTGSGEVYSPSQQFFLQASEAEVGFSEGWLSEALQNSGLPKILSSLRLHPYYFIPTGERTISSRLKQLSSLHDSKSDPVKRVQAKIAGIQKWKQLSWAYSTPHLPALVWLELLLCVQHDLYCRQCDFCRMWFVTHTSRVLYCPSCRNSPVFQADLQRKRRAELDGDHKNKEQALHRDQMEVRRGGLKEAKDFLLRYPNYQPRKGSEFYKMLLKAARSMVEEGEMDELRYRELFPDEKVPDY